VFSKCGRLNIAIFINTECTSGVYNHIQLVGLYDHLIWQVYTVTYGWCTQSHRAEY